MNAFLHQSENRGHVKADWLDTKYSFSFGDWYNLNYMGVGVLRAINDETIAPQHGFAPHSHSNMEILTCVLEGTICHSDSLGNERHITAGEWQLMSAGQGVQHSEMNQKNHPVRMLQIWIHPNIQDTEPHYQQMRCHSHDQPNRWHLIASASCTTAMCIQQQTEIKTAVLEKYRHLAVKATQKVNYIHVIAGKISIEERILTAGDALLFAEDTQIKALQDSQLIWFDLPEI